MLNFYIKKNGPRLLKSQNILVFPYFSTNITTVNPQQRTSNDDRVRLLITDEAATMTFYVNYLKKQRKSLTPLLNEISQNWPNLS